MKRGWLVAGALALNACGQSAELRPQAGASLPVKPVAARTTPTADVLIRPDDQARPQRNDDLLQQSQTRKPDRFDLPPPG